MRVETPIADQRLDAHALQHLVDLGGPRGVGHRLVGLGVFGFGQEGSSGSGASLTASTWASAYAATRL